MTKKPAEPAKPGKGLHSPEQRRATKAATEIADPSKTAVEKIHAAARYRGGKP